MFLVYKHSEILRNFFGFSGERVIKERVLLVLKNILEGNKMEQMQRTGRNLNELYEVTQRYEVLNDKPLEVILDRVKYLEFSKCHGRQYGDYKNHCKGILW